MHTDINNHKLHQLILKHLYLFGFMLFASCCSFDKEKATKMFQNSNPDYEIISATEYECSGTNCECWYVKFQFTTASSKMTKDTTVQFWVGENALMMINN